MRFERVARIYQINDLLFRDYLLLKEISPEDKEHLLGTNEDAKIERTSASYRILEITHHAYCNVFLVAVYRIYTDGMYYHLYREKVTGIYRFEIFRRIHLLRWI
jgi:hypothetical protein